MKVYDVTPTVSNEQLQQELQNYIKEERRRMYRVGVQSGVTIGRSLKGTIILATALASMVLTLALTAP